MIDLPTTVSIHIACACNAAYLPHVATLLQSIVAANCNASLVAHVLHDSSIDVSEQKKLCDALIKQGMQVEFHQPDERRLAGLTTNSRYPAVVWFRALLPELLPALDRIIYLDADMIVLHDLRALWATDLEECTLAAVADIPHPTAVNHWRSLKLDSAADQFNTGLLLMDLSRMRQGCFTDALLVQGRIGMETRLPDQDAYNMTVQGHWKRLHPKWNCMSPLFPGHMHHITSSHKKLDQIEAATSPCIVHFEGGLPHEKPWHHAYDHPHKALYMAYRAMTPWPLHRLDGNSWRGALYRRMPRWLHPFLLWTRASLGALSENIRGLGNVKSRH